MNAQSSLRSPALAFMLVLAGGFVSAQYEIPAGATLINDFPWPEGKSMALSLTFDDARLSQADIGIPLLDRHGVKATFYVSPKSMSLREEAWKKAARNGHDMGNHTVNHPCTGNFEFSRHKALENRSLKRMRSEMDSANMVIRESLGVSPVSFAYPCGQTFVGRGARVKSYVPLVARKFESGRLWLSEGPNNPYICDMAQLLGMELDGKSFSEIKKLIESAKEKRAWLIFAGHEINIGGRQTSLISTLDSLCSYAKDPPNGIWIDNVHNIATYINGQRGGSVRKQGSTAVEDR